jgi:protein SCO1/2
LHVETQPGASAVTDGARKWARTRRSLVTLAAVMAVSVAGWLLWQRFGPRPGPQFGVAVNASTAVADFRLDSTLGKPMALSDFADRYTVLYFGYTTCPDICPTTLADLGKAEQLMGAAAERIQVIFVTVDPERDTPQRMRDYLAYFSPNFIGMSGALEETERIASQLGVIYEKRYASESATDYLMDHTATTIVLDPQRRPQLLFPYGVTGEQIASDLSALIR